MRFLIPKSWTVLLIKFLIPTCILSFARVQAGFAVKSVTSIVDSGIMLTWESEAGALYEIQFSENLSPASWRTLYPDMP